MRTDVVVAVICFIIVAGAFLLADRHAANQDRRDREIAKIDGICEYLGADRVQNLCVKDGAVVYEREK